MLTIEDIRNPKRKSGFDYVNQKTDTRPGRTGKSYRAQKRVSSGNGRGPWWIGSNRAFPEEAAQDYCDYINGQPPQVPALPAYPEVTIDMGNTKRHAPKMETVKVVRPAHVGAHDLYDVMFFTSMGDLVCRKAGITARGTARYADVCKTLGLSIKPFKEAVTYPTKDAALAAEKAYIAEICKDPKWVRIGQESFALDIGAAA